MIRNYWTPEEFFRSYPIRNLTNTADLPGILGKAAFQVGEDLRSQGNRARSFQVPVMFETDLDSFEAKTFTSDTTSTYTDGVSSSRLIVDCTAKPANNADAVVTLEGCMDETPDASSVWLPVISETNVPVSIRVNSAMLYTEPFSMQARNYRYKVDTDESVTMRIYMVDGATDELVGLKALINILRPLKDGVNERIYELFNDARSEYDEALGKLIAAYDVDDDNAVESGETETRNRRTLYR